ncbi:unnamed protein product, partial [Coregonus sp. 'balchen']
ELQFLLQVNIQENQTLISSGSTTAKVLKCSLLLRDFQSEEIPLDKQDPEYNSPDICILHIRRAV